MLDRRSRDLLWKPDLVYPQTLVLLVPFIIQDLSKSLLSFRTPEANQTKSLQKRIERSLKEVDPSFGITQGKKISHIVLQQVLKRLGYSLTGTKVIEILFEAKRSAQVNSYIICRTLLPILTKNLGIIFHKLSPTVYLKTGKNPRNPSRARTKFSMNFLKWWRTG